MHNHRIGILFSIGPRGNETVKFQDIWMVPKGCYNCLGILYWPHCKNGWVNFTQNGSK